MREVTELKLDQSRYTHACADAHTQNTSRVTLGKFLDLSVPQGTGVGHI